MRILRHHFRAAHPRASISVAAGIALLALAGPRATAQESPYIDTSHPNVFVDLSVLDDGGYIKQATAMPPTSGGRILLVPGAQPPVSRLFVAPAPAAAEPVAALAQADSRLHVEPPQPPVQPLVMAPEKPPVTAAPEPPAMAPPPPPAEPEAVAKAEPEPEAATEPKATAVLTPPPPAAETEPPEAAAAPQPKAEEQASLPPASGPPKPGKAMQVVFPDSASKLPGAAKEELRSLAARIKDQDSLRLQLLAYAGGKSLSASKARRLSLSRALAVRSYLIESGVRSTRIDVRALGNKTSEKPENRVDINVVER